MMTPPPSGQGRINGLGKGSDGREGLVRSFFETNTVIFSGMFTSFHSAIFDPLCSISILISPA